MTLSWRMSLAALCASWELFEKWKVCKVEWGACASNNTEVFSQLAAATCFETVCAIQTWSATISSAVFFSCNKYMLFKLLGEINLTILFKLQQFINRLYWFSCNYFNSLIIKLFNKKNLQTFSGCRFANEMFFTFVFVHFLCQLFGGLFALFVLDQ